MSSNTLAIERLRGSGIDRRRFLRLGAFAGAGRWVCRPRFPPPAMPPGSFPYSASRATSAWARTARSG